MSRDNYTRRRFSGLRIIGTFFMAVGLILLVWTGVQVCRENKDKFRNSGKYLSEDIEENERENIEKTGKVFPMLFLSSMMIIFSIPVFYASRSKGGIWLDSRSKCRDDKCEIPAKDTGDAYDFIIGDADRERFRSMDSYATAKHNEEMERRRVERLQRECENSLEKYIHVESVGKAEKNQKKKDESENTKMLKTEKTKKAVSDKKQDKKSSEKRAGGLFGFKKAVSASAAEEKPEEISEKAKTKNIANEGKNSGKTAKPAKKANNTAKAAVKTSANVKKANNNSKKKNKGKSARKHKKSKKNKKK